MGNVGDLRKRDAIIYWLVGNYELKYMFITFPGLNSGLQYS